MSKTPGSPRAGHREPSPLATFVGALLVTLLAAPLPVLARRSKRRGVRSRRATATPRQRPAFVIGDVHGDLRRAQQILASAGIVDSHGHWAANNTRLTFVGDLVNKGKRSLGVLRFARRLEQQAARAGGRVDVALGNHEALLTAATLAVKELSADERSRLFSYERGIDALRRADALALKLLVLAHGDAALARGLAARNNIALAASSAALMQSAAADVAGVLAMFGRKGSLDLWASFIANGGETRVAVALARDNNAQLLSWLQARPAMLEVGSDLVIHSDAPASYSKLGSTIQSVNRAARGKLASKKGAFELFELLTERHGFTSRRVTEQLLATFGGDRVIHGHTSFKGAAPQVHDGGKRVNVDASLSDAFGGGADRGLLMQLGQHVGVRSRLRRLWGAR